MSPKKSSYSDLSDTSDQELVDLYRELAAVFGAKEGPSHDHRIQQTASAAHALETRGYVEQSGIWIHPEKPHFAATA